VSLGLDYILLIFDLWIYSQRSNISAFLKRSVGC
jgi:hypothetical protein